MKRKNIKGRLTTFFYNHPTAKKRVRELERELNLPLPSVIKYCKELLQEKIIKKINVGSVAFYSADRSSHLFIQNKKLHNLNLIYCSGLIEFIKEKLHNPTIIVFGSFAMGEDIETSDLDLFIGTNKKVSLEKFEKKIGRKIQTFHASNIQDIKNKELANNIVNGFVINGFLEVF